MLAEDCQLLAFAGSPQNAEWLDDDQAAALLDAEPEANVPPEQAVDFVRKVVEGYDRDRPSPERRGKASRGRAAQSPPPRSRGLAPQRSQPEGRAHAAARRAGYLRVLAQTLRGRCAQRGSSPVRGDIIEAGV